MANSEIDKVVKEWSAMTAAEGVGGQDAADKPDKAADTINADQLTDKASPQLGADGNAKATNTAPPQEPGHSVKVNTEANVGEALSQEEIDAILGTQQTRKVATSGFSMLTDTKNVGENRLTLLDVIYERLVRRASTSLRKFSSDSIDISLDGSDLIRFGDYLNQVNLPAMIGVFRAEEWDNYGLITLNSSLIYSIIEVLLGGHRSKSNYNRSRAYTALDTSLIERFVSVILDDLTAAFDPIYPISIRLERIETNPRFASFTLPSNVSHRGKFVINIDDRGGVLEIVLPLATLEPVRDVLTQSFLGEKFGRDVVWEKHFRSSLNRTHIDVNALLAERYMNLSDVREWKKGQVIPLFSKPDDLITLSCNGRSIFKALMGNREGRLAMKIKKKVKIEDRLDHQSFLL